MSVGKNQRSGNRTKAVIPVKVKGRDSSGKDFEEVAHTLDITSTGARLGSIRRELNLLDEVTVFYRQRKLQFRVMWKKKLQGTSEFQIGLKALSHDRETWGLSFSDKSEGDARPAVAAGAV